MFTVYSGLFGVTVSAETLLSALKQKYQLWQHLFTYGGSAYLHEMPPASGHVWARSIEYNLSLAIGAWTVSDIPVEMICIVLCCCSKYLLVQLFVLAAICTLIRFLFFWWCWWCVYEEGELVDFLAFLPAEKDRTLVVTSNLFLDVPRFFFLFRFSGSEFQRHSRGFPL